MEVVLKHLEAVLTMQVFTYGYWVTQYYYSSLKYEVKILYGTTVKSRMECTHMDCVLNVFLNSRYRSSKCQSDYNFKSF